MHQVSAKGKQRGQGMTEYIIIVALIGVSAIGVYRFFGETIRQQMAGLSKEVAGVDASAEIANAAKAADSAKAQADEKKTLSTYNKGNND